MYLAQRNHKEWAKSINYNFSLLTKPIYPHNKIYWAKEIKL